MKEKIIKTDKATLLVVELPEGSYYPNICQLPPTIGVNYFLYENGVNTPYKEPLNIPKGNWHIIGRIPDITDGDLYTLGFRADNLSSILDKLEHLIIKNNIYFKNIYGETKPLPPWQDLIESEGLHVNYKHRLKLWQEAQSKVWDKERTYLFIKVD